MLLPIAVLALAAAGCGGGGGGGTTSATTTTAAGGSGQAVHGSRFSFTAPKDWTVKTTATSATATADPKTLVFVTALPLLKPYRPALFPRVVGELDRVAHTLAGQLGGKVTSKSTVTAAGGKAREYVIEHSDLVDRITFVLKGKREYQLTCRWPKADGEPAACAQLVASFRTP